jgi:hypothetical protein
MKKSKLQQIIREEIKSTLNESVDVSSLGKLANSYRSLADGIETGGRSLQKLQDYINRGGPIPGEDGKMIDTSYTIEKTSDEEANYNFGMGSPFILRDGEGKPAYMTYTAEHISDMAKKLPMIKVRRNPNYTGIYFVITGREKTL